MRAFARTAHGSLRDDLDLEAVAASPLAPDLRRRARRTGHARGRHDGAPAQRARHAHPQGRARHGVPRDVGVREVLDRGCAPRDRRRERRREHRPGRRASAGGEPPLHTGPAVSGGAASGGRGPVRRAFAGITQGWAVIGAHMAVGLVDDRMLGDGLREGGRIVHECDPRCGGRTDRRREGAAHAVLRGGGAAAADGIAAGRAAGAPRAPPHGVAARLRRAHGGAARRVLAIRLRRTRRATRSPPNSSAPSRRCPASTRARPRSSGEGSQADARPDYMEQAGRGTRGVRHRQVHRDLRQRALGRPRPRGVPRAIRCPPPHSERCGTWPTSSTTRSATPATC